MPRYTDNPKNLKMQGGRDRPSRALDLDVSEDTCPMIERIATNLAWVMRRRRVSARRLAERSLLGHDRVEAILAGAWQPRVDEIFLLAGALEVEPAVLIEGIAWVADGRGGGGYRIRRRGD